MMRGKRANGVFGRELRRALYRLYDPVVLSQSPLMAWLGLDRSRPSLLQRVLCDAIEALRPERSASPQSDAWRTYRTLTHRFVDQFSQREVARVLGLSIRQMRREESSALCALADYIQTHYHIEVPASTSETGGAPGTPAGQEHSLPGPLHSMPHNSLNHSHLRPADAPSTPEQELQWLEQSLRSEVVEAAEVILPALKVATPLAETAQVRLACTIPEGLPRVAVQLASIRQALVNVLTAAIYAVPEGHVDVQVTARQQEICLHIEPGLSQKADSPPGDPADNLAMASQLAALSGASLAVSRAERPSSPFVATLTLPAVEQAAVLVIDDNADTLQLFQRYLAGSRYPFIGVRDPQQALALAAGLAPRIIVLDVMLPGVDGWELLGRLREHPKTRDVPIIVCTILPLAKLALTLGAADFIQKPVTREALLATLDRQLA